jgi:nephrocystin-3
MGSQAQAKKRSIRVFISSTFRDMIDDRNELMAQCWPQLRKLCQERQVEFTEVDLRWGISEEQSERKETLQLCLDEIHNCRPYFIGLLGERYGWMPGKEVYTERLLKKEPWLKELLDKSVTELEILHGVLNDPEMSGRTYFFFRDPTYLDTLPPERRKEFLSDDASGKIKQDDLKSRIRKACKDNGIFLKENYANPRELAQQVLKQLKAAIDAEYPKDETLDPLDKEAFDHEAFAELRRRTYIGRPEYYDALDNHCSENGTPMVLLGASGSGKSALIANWIPRWQKWHPDDFIFQHYIGGTADSSNHRKLMRRLIKEIKSWTEDSEEIPTDNDALRRDFQIWLNKARFSAEKRGCRFIIILDALNQLEDIENSRLLSWLPSEPFRGALRLIVSTLPGKALESISNRHWDFREIKPLDPKERKEMITHYLHRFGQTLEGTRLDLILSKDQTSNPLYLKILLDELRVTGSFEGLDDLLLDYLAAPDIPALLQKVLNRYRRDYEHVRPGLVKDALSLIYAARRGLSEIELLQLLKPENQSQLPMVFWAPLRAALGEGLVDRGGILNFAHDYFKQAVKAAFLPANKKVRDLRLHLTAFFEKLVPSMRTCDELPYLLWQTESFVRLIDLIVNIDVFLLIIPRDECELQVYWVKLGEEKRIEQLYKKAFLGWEKVNSSERVAYGARVLGMFFYTNSLFYSAEILLRKALEIDERLLGQTHQQVADDLNAIALVLYATDRSNESESYVRRALKIDEETHEGWHPVVADDLNNLAIILKAKKQYHDAETMLQRALQIKKGCFGNEHLCLWNALNNLALLFQTTNRFRKAEPLFRRALQIAEDNLGKDHWAVATSLNNLAELLRVLKRYKESELLFRRALTIDEQIYGKDHIRTAIRLSNLSLVLKVTMRLDEAEMYSRRSIDIVVNLCRITGFKDPYLSILVNNFYLLLRSKGYSKKDALIQILHIAPEHLDETNDSKQ